MWLSSLKKSVKRQRYRGMALFDVLAKMDLTAAQREHLGAIIENSCMTLRSFTLLSDQELGLAGFPLPAVMEMRSLIESMQAQTLNTTPTAASLRSLQSTFLDASRTSSPLSDISINSSASNQENFLPELTSDQLRELIENIEVSTYAGKHEFNRILVAELMKVI